MSEFQQREAKFVKNVTIHTATIEHRHGINSYTGTTYANLQRELADYCRGEWEDEMMGAEMPEEDVDVVEKYFSYTSSHEEILEESSDHVPLTDIMDVLELVTVRQHEPDKCEVHEGYVPDGYPDDPRLSNGDMAGLQFSINGFDPGDPDCVVDYLKSLLHAAHAAGQEPVPLLARAFRLFMAEAS